MLPASWRPKRGPTNYVPYLWGGQMASNWSLLPEIQHDTVHFGHSPVWLHPQVRIGDFNRTPKILGVTLDTHFTFGPHSRDCVELASRALNFMKVLAGSSLGFMTETLVASSKVIVRPIFNYAAPIWFTQVSSSHLDKLEVIQNKLLRIAIGCHQKAAASHLRAETGVVSLRAHLELCCQQFYSNVLQPLHPSHTTPSFRRLGRWPHLPQLPLHRPHGGPPL